MGNDCGRCGVFVRNRRGSLSINVHELTDEGEEDPRVLELYFRDVVLPLSKVPLLSHSLTLFRVDVHVAVFLVWLVLDSFVGIVVLVMSLHMVLYRYDDCVWCLWFGAF